MRGYYVTSLHKVITCIKFPRLQVIAKLLFIYTKNLLFIEWLILIIEQ